MAGSLNKVQLIGNLGKDPEIRTIQDGRQIATFSIATSETWKDKNTGEKREKTEWHNIVVYNEALVKVVSSYVKKGSKLYIEGQIQTRKWQDQNGQDRYTTEIVLQNYAGTLIMLDGRAAQSGASHQMQDYGNSFGAVSHAPQSNFQPASQMIDDDIPF